MKLPFVISMPHCSSRVPEAIRSRLALSDEEIVDTEDFGSAEVFGELPAKFSLKAEWSRLVADLNRSSEDRGEKGVIARTDYRGRRIFRPGMYPDEETFQQWIREYHRPYHDSLAAALADPGIKGLFDCHSLNGTGPADAPDAGQQRKDIIISNNGSRSGKRDPRLGEPTCSVDIIRNVAAVFEQAGFSTAINDPYQGGFITVNYGKSLISQGKFALQIEMNQDLCLYPGTLRPDPEKIREVRGRVSLVFQEIV